MRISLRHLAENLRLGRDFTVSQRVDTQIANLTLSEVNAALRKYLRADQLVIGVGGDFKN